MLYCKYRKDVTDMSERAKHSVQARCEDIGLVMRAAFWLYGVYVLILLGLGIWMLAQGADQFSLHVTQTQNGAIGQGFFRNMLEIDFSRSSLRADAAQQAKLAYLIGFFTAWIAKVLFCGILYQVRSIFRSIAQEQTPFVLKNCQALRRIGILIPVISVIRQMCPLVLMLCGIGEGGTGSLIQIDQWLIGGVVLSLSYIFEYGTILQKESDETL